MPILQDLPPLPLPAPINSAAANGLEALPPPLPAPRDSVAADEPVPALDDGCRSCTSNDGASATTNGLEALPSAPRDSVAADESVLALDDGYPRCASNDDAAEAALAMVLQWGV